MKKSLPSALVLLLVGYASIHALGCNHSKSSNGGSTSKDAVGKADAGAPTGGGNGATISTGSDGCAEDDSLYCESSQGVTCWGGDYPDPGVYDCSDGTDEGDGYTGYCCY